MSAQLYYHTHHHIKLFKYPSRSLPRDSEACFCIPFKAIVSTKKVWLFTSALARSASLAQQPAGPSLGTLASTGWDRCREPKCHHPGRDSSNRGASRPVAAPRPLYSLAAPPPCPAPWGPLLFAVVPGAGLKHHLAVRALERDPPFGRRMPLWLRAFEALGDTCREQRLFFCLWRIFPQSAFKCVS